MRLSTLLRILSREWSMKSLREHSWDWRLRSRRLWRLRRARGFRRYVLRDWRRFLGRTARPVRGENEERAHAAVEWLLLAQRASPDPGVSVGYFPCNDTAYGGWHPSYPETTGYIIESLLEYARVFDQPDIRRRALEMADWEVAIQMPSGAVQSGPVTEPGSQQAAVFNTGMVLQGWTAALADGGGSAVEDAARRAADFLVADLGEDCHYRTQGPHFEGGGIKLYTCLCSWALHRFGEHVCEAKYRDAAVRNVEASIVLQRPNGWFAENCLSDPERPLTHTIGYALQGILEVGLAAGRDEFVEAVRRGIDPILERIQPSGFLHGRFFSDWRPATLSSCLTGSAQIAVVCYRLHTRLGDEKYRVAADRLIDYLKGLQEMDPRFPEFRGALAGSHPVTASYMTYGFPNWATKYLLDALLLQGRLSADS